MVKKKSSRIHYSERVEDSRFAAVVKAFAGTSGVSREERQELVSDGRGERFDPGGGRVMKEWCEVHDAKTDWVALAREAFAFAGRG